MVPWFCPSVECSCWWRGLASRSSPISITRWKGISVFGYHHQDTVSFHDGGWVVLLLLITICHSYDVWGQFITWACRRKDNLSLTNAEIGVGCVYVRFRSLSILCRWGSRWYVSTSADGQHAFIPSFDGIEGNVFCDVSLQDSKPWGENSVCPWNQLIV